MKTIHTIINRSPQSSYDTQVWIHQGKRRKEGAEQDLNLKLNNCPKCKSDNIFMPKFRYPMTKFEGRMACIQCLTCSHGTGYFEVIYKSGAIHNTHYVGKFFKKWNISK